MATESKRKSKKKSKTESPFQPNGKSSGNSFESAGVETVANNMHDLFTGKWSAEKPSDLFDSGKIAPWLWALSDHYVTSDIRAQIQKCYQLSNKGKGSHKDNDAIFQKGIEDFENPSNETERALATLAWITWACIHKGNLSETEQLQAAELIVEFAETLRAPDLLEDPWANQVLNCEVPLTLACLFHHVQDFKDAAKQAIKSWSHAVETLLDGDGWIDGRYMVLLRPLLACWTRCSMLAKRLKLSMPKERRLQLEWSIRQSLRLCRKGGTQLLGNAQSEFGMKRFWHAALNQFGDREDRIAASFVLGFPRPPDWTSMLDVPEFSGLSEWAAVGVMRQSWKSDAGKIAVLFSNQRFSMEIEVNKRLVVDTTLPVISLDDRILSVQSEIDVACWHSDDDVDYLELEIELDNQVCLQRQILLAREDNFVFIADAIISQVPGKLKYDARYFVGPGLETMNEVETNEIYLKDSSIRAMVLPLSAPEWRVEKNSRIFGNDSTSWTIRQESNDQYLYAPLFIDLSPKRSKKPRTWRTLTVAERLEVLRGDAAKCYRVQIGKEQWLFYRSLAPKASRTFLGQNMNCEFFAGRFDKEGETEELLSIE
jgi:hypothetical protein